MDTHAIQNGSEHAKWQEALTCLEIADAVYEEYRAAADPLYRLQEAFEAKHGLVPPGGGRIGTPLYFERRAKLLMQHPEYRVPDEISDRLEKFTEAVCDAQTVLMETPAPDLVALRWKLEHTSGTSWEGAYIAQMQADIEALMVEA